MGNGAVLSRQHHVFKLKHFALAILLISHELKHFALAILLISHGR
jgi:hypothetical protein